jgi:hypothetical protein
MLNTRVLERKEFRERDKQNRHKKIPWFSHENLRPHTKAFDGYIFIIILHCYNEIQVGYIY